MRNFFKNLFKKEQKQTKEDIISSYLLEKSEVLENEYNKQHQLYVDKTCLAMHRGDLNEMDKAKSEWEEIKAKNEQRQDRIHDALKAKMELDELFYNFLDTF